ncbi:hypothetical protein E3N88_33581 [Mikania micrantha]|uniref:Uncharacterized protein n=1 Tax=Mikania micrantha TaxID=192012 RepID=A0A5N6MBY0_9ASTR|nr:hypothetical protein E3N88_33581 [Mikania micrantha]
MEEYMKKEVWNLKMEENDVFPEGRISLAYWWNIGGVKQSQNGVQANAGSDRGGGSTVVECADRKMGSAVDN